MQDESRLILGSAIALDGIQWTVLTALLAHPPYDNPGLRALLTAPTGNGCHDLPTVLTRTTIVDGFGCGVDFLDEAVVRADRDEHAIADGRDMHFFGTTHRGRLAAYYSQRRSLIRRYAPSAGPKEQRQSILPIMLLARLAVALPFQGAGLGRGLLRDAIIRAAAESDVRLFYVHALSPAVKHFYRRHGFRPMAANIDPLGMFITMAEVDAIVGTACAEPANG